MKDVWKNLLFAVTYLIVKYGINFYKIIGKNLKIG